MIQNEVIHTKISDFPPFIVEVFISRKTTQELSGGTMNNN
jgi:hypothetical protein